MPKQEKATNGAPDRASALKQIPTEQHAVADYLAAQGLDWGSILAILLQALPGLINAFKKKSGTL